MFSWCFFLSKMKIIIVLKFVNMIKPLKLNSLKRWLAHCLRLQLVIDWRADNGKIGEKIPLFQIQATTKILSSRWPRALHVFSKNISQYVARLMSFFLQFGRTMISATITKWWLPSTFLRYCFCFIFLADLCIWLELESCSFPPSVLSFFYIYMCVRLHFCNKVLYCWWLSSTFLSLCNVCTAFLFFIFSLADAQQMAASATTK